MQNITSRIGPAASGVEIRPLTAGDRERLADAFSRLSEETRRQRFLALAKRLSERDLDRLTQIDHHNHEALAAIAPRTDRIVGVARYIKLPDDPGAAEVALAVDDEWQQRGIGRRLLAELIARAAVHGVTRLVAYVGEGNRRTLDWLARMGWDVVGSDENVTVFEIAPMSALEARRAA
jgi:GNAT superfamily N-acetyltransferase